MARDKTIRVRVSEDEYDATQRAVTIGGFRHVSELIRSKVQEVTEQYEARQKQTGQSQPDHR